MSSWFWIGGIVYVLCGAFLAGTGYKTLKESLLAAVIAAFFWPVFVAIMAGIAVQGVLRK